MHRPCRPRLVADEAELAVIFRERADHERDVIGIFLPEQFGQGDGALLVVEFFQAAQKLAQCRLRVGANVVGKAVGGKAEVFQPLGKAAHPLPAGLQAVKQGVDGGRGGLRRFAQRDEGGGEGGGLFGGETKLFGAAADAGQRFNDFGFFGGGVVAEGVDGIAQGAHFGQRNLEDVGELRRAVAR